MEIICIRKHTAHILGNALERIDKFKVNMKATVKKQFHEMKINSDFTESVRQQVYNSFSGLKAQIEQETEIILKDTQKTLDDLNDVKQQKKAIPITMHILIM